MSRFSKLVFCIAVSLAMFMARLAGAEIVSGVWPAPGSGFLTVDRCNTFTGGTTISAGSLQISDSGSLVLTRAGSNTYSGGTTITGGTLQLGNVNSFGLTLGGSNMYSGGTLVSSGTVDFTIASGVNSIGGSTRNSAGGPTTANPTTQIQQAPSPWATTGTSAGLAFGGPHAATAAPGVNGLGTTFGASVPFSLSNGKSYSAAGVNVASNVTSGPADPSAIPIGPAINGGLGTHAAILDGAYAAVSPSRPLTMAWRNRTPNEAATPVGTFNPIGPLVASSSTAVTPKPTGHLASDVVNISGVNVGSDYVLQMDYSSQVEPNGADDAANKHLYLSALAPGQSGFQWQNAITQNSSVTLTTMTYDPSGKPIFGHITEPMIGVDAYDGGTAPYMGSYQSFESYVSNRYGSSTPLYKFRSTWGVDAPDHVVWSVLDSGGGVFAVDPVPEPSSLALLGVAALGLLGYARRRRTT